MTIQKRSYRLLSTTALTRSAQLAVAVGAMVLASSSAWAVDDLVTPQGENVVGGSAAFDRPAEGLLNINQGTDRVVINWDSFNIGKKAATQFHQPGSNALAVNRVTGKGENPTQILGSLKANGRVMVLDRNGVIFGADSRVDVGGIVASTGDVDTASVMNGDKVLQIKNVADGTIVNEGQVNVSEAGLAAFVAPTIRNSGVINAKLGKVALAAGRTNATVDLYGDGLVEFALDGEKTRAIVDNSGVINAESGTVALTASAAKEVVDDAINMSGIIKVSSVSVEGGKIVLSGGSEGQVGISGQLEASGKTGGGKIEIQGRNVKVGAGSRIVADAIESGNGGKVSLIADNKMAFEGSVSARGGADSGDGGFVEVSGYSGLDFRGVSDTTAAHGDLGTLLLDPRFLVIHSGPDLPSIFDGYVISDDVLAYNLRTNDVILQADDFIDVGTRKGSYGLSISGNPADDAALNSFLNVLPDDDLDLASWSDFYSSGTTNGSLTLQSDLVNFNRNVKMGNGNLTADAPLVNLDSRIFASDGVTSLSESRLFGTSLTHTVNVISGDALIQQGISLVANGGAVNVGAGTYNESVNVGKTIMLNGANAGNTTGVRLPESIIDPNSPGIHVTADGTVVDGFTVTGADIGIHVDHAKNVGILNNIIHDDTEDGIFVDHSNNALVEGNVVYNTGKDGIRVEDSSGVRVLDNAVGFLDLAGATSAGPGNIHGDGISARKAHGIVVRSNRITDTISPGNTIGSGIQILGTNGASVRDNDISNTGWDGIRIANSQKIDVEENSIENSDRTGIYLSNVYLGKALNNAIAGASAFYGIDVDGSTNISLIGNEISDTHLAGINFNTYSPGTKGINIVEGNTIDNTGGDGIRALRVAGLTIAGNSIGTNGGPGNINGDGILANATHGVVIKSNTIENTVTPGNTIGSGIQVLGTNGADVRDNDISNTGWDGIRVANSQKVNVEGNSIEDADRSGIYLSNIYLGKAADNAIDRANTFYGIDVDGSTNISLIGNVINDTHLAGINFNTYSPGTKGINIVEDNTIDNTGGDGVRVFRVAGLTIAGNAVGTNGGPGNINGDGILANTTHGVVIKSNTIENTVTSGNTIGSGIQILGTNGADVLSNTISNTGWDGIRIANSQKVNVENNTIDTVDRSGIYLSNIYLGKALNNYIHGAKNFYGIDVDGGTTLSLIGNEIDDTHLAGINFNTYSPGTKGTNIVEGNTIDNTGSDGIHAFRVTGLTIADNDVGTNGGPGNINGDGIFAGKTDGVVITSNTIGNTVSSGNMIGNGVQILGTNGATIGNNTISNVSWDGIRIANSQNINVENNDIDNVVRTGIYLSNIYLGKALNNKINGAQTFYGIDVDGGTTISLIGNEIDGAHLAGINFNTYSPRTKGINIVDDNTIDNTDGDGIHASHVENLTVSNNAIGTNGGPGNIGDDGIEITGFTDNLIIGGNTVENAVNNGLFISGAGNGSVRVENNTFTNNDVHARFQSGVIDLTGPGNTFADGRVGLRFDPVGPATGLTLVDDDAPGFSPASEDPPTNFGGTIGAQTFENQSQYFVELASGAFFAPGAPTWLNAANSMYNGNPASPLVLEPLFYHWVDDPSLGRFWLGSL
jgi:filamentous hemagglutinin family protein